jgi:CheY-like chemotaxis protein
MKNLPNLLIVDDCDESLATLEQILAPLEVNLISARSGEEALKKSRGVELAVALLDVRMPGMDGFELAKKINKARPLSRVPIILYIPAHSDPSFRSKVTPHSGHSDPPLF